MCSRVAKEDSLFLARGVGAGIPYAPKLGCASIRCAAKQFMAELQPWIEREKAEHIQRIVAIAKRGFRRIEKLWDENEIPEVRTESLAAATLDKHDAIIRRNLAMNETQGGSGTLNLDVLVAGGRRIVSAQKPAA